MLGRRQRPDLSRSGSVRRPRCGDPPDGGASPRGRRLRRTASIAVPPDREPAISQAGRLLDRFPGPPIAVAGTIATGVDACFDCAQGCTACADDCLDEHPRGDRGPAGRPARRSRRGHLQRAGARHRAVDPRHRSATHRAQGAADRRVAKPPVTAGRSARISSMGHSLLAGDPAVGAAARWRRRRSSTGSSGPLPPPVTA